MLALREARRMYVCICHGVTEDDVRGHMAAGARSPKEVRAACGMRPGCGACVQRIGAMVSEGATHPHQGGSAP